jgi:predicted nucleic acid-binding protein
VTSYVDTSSIVRRIVGDGTPLVSWGTWDVAVASEVGRIEFHRTIARLLHERALNVESAANALREFGEIESGILWVPLNERVAEIAAGPFPAVLKALDAIHLASALFVRETLGAQVVFVTHDRQLATAAAALGFPIEGYDFS